MSLGSDTSVVNGQRFTFPTTAAYAPTQYGPQTTGVPQVSPTMPPYIGGGGSVTASGAAEGVGGYGTAGNNQQVTAIAAAHPYSLKVSPVFWAVGGLVIGLLLLNGIHWRKTTLQGAEEHAHVGAVSESASESA